MKICPKCQVLITEDTAYKYGKENRLQRYCKECFNKYCVQRWIQKKKDLSKPYGWKMSGDIVSGTQASGRPTTIQSPKHVHTWCISCPSRPKQSPAIAPAPLHYTLGKAWAYYLVRLGAQRFLETLAPLSSRALKALT